MDLKRQLTSFLRVPERVTLLFAGRADGTAAPVTPTDPLPVAFAPGATSDPDAAREATLQQVRDGITALAALLGSTDNLESLLSTQATYLDQVESLLTTLGGQTDGLEGLLAALGVKDDANLAKLEDLRALLANIDTHGQAANGNSFILASQAQGDGLRVLPLGGATETTLASLLAALNLLSRKTDTQPVSAASLPLPTGAATQVTLAALLTAIQAQAAKTETQPISAAALPLPTGAATQATLAALLTAIQAQAAKTETQPVSAAALPLPAGAATGALQTTGNTSLASILAALTGTVLVRSNPDIPVITTLNIAAGTSASDSLLLNTQALAAIDLGPNWTAADLSVEHSTDGGATWYPMYDTFGNLIQYRIAANRSVAVPLSDLMRRGRIRFRSGVPGAYVNQAAVTALTVTMVTV
ncbi:hypothetical protein [Deinococcus aquaticus]|uniref:hypothetical protein n=1 Tax=Deinococcus aquaticus TaxID=328692 RepID=UPI003F44D82F